MKDLNLKSFMCVFSEQFEEEDVHIHSHTKFKELEDWSSLQSLIVITALDEAFKYVLSADDIREAETVEDLYQIMRKVMQQ